MHRQVNPVSPLFVFGSFWNQRSLIWEMTKRDVVGRYRGSAMGILWSFLNPILMLAVYTFVFNVVFQARWGGESSSRIEFAIVLFVGMIIHALFAECVNKAPTLILANVNYVKKVVFPLEILPWVTMGSALFHTLISVLVLLAAFALTHSLSQLDGRLPSAAARSSGAPDHGNNLVRGIGRRLSARRGTDHRHHHDDHAVPVAGVLSRFPRCRRSIASCSRSTR